MMKEEINPQIRNEDVHDLIPYLPSEIVLNILLRIPTRAVMRCKCVCKAWRDLLDTREFVQSHLSKSVPGLAFYQLFGKRYRIVEFDDEHRLNTVFSFDLPFISCYIRVHSYANGLLFVCKQKQYQNHPLDSFVCNPITREYITIPNRKKFPLSQHEFNYGFGVSKVSGEYKVVMICFDMFDCRHDCQVYTVGSGSWRRIEFDHQLRYRGNAVGRFLNGNLHWIDDLSFLISFFDLETERFSTFSPPRHHENFCLSVLGDYLCVCYTFAQECERFAIELWLMKEYGDEKSWTKAYRFDKRYGKVYHCPIKLFNDGDILMQWGEGRLLYYSKKHDRLETIQENSGDAIIYAPSFLSLKTFAMENVSTF